MKKLFFWILTLAAPILLFSQNWIVYTPHNTGLADDRVNAIASDAYNNIWIGTSASSNENIGLSKFDGTYWHVYGSENSDLHETESIISIEIDGNGVKWIGSYTSGLAKFDGTNWTVYDTSNSGLPNDIVWAIAIDESGDKWIGTNGGLAVYTEGGVVSVESNKNNISPTDFMLYQNYPNPFNPTTKIKYSIPKTSNVQLKVFDILGRKVAELVNEEKPAGNYTVNFNASKLSSSIYFY